VSLRLWLFVALAGLLPAASPSQQLPTDLEAPSLMTTPVLLFNGSREVSQGTGFFFANLNSQGDDAAFLVTNYHVVTGRSPQSTERPTGDRVRFMIHEDSSNLAAIRVVELPLYDSGGQPLWIASRDHPEADVVLLPIPQRAYAPIRLLVFTESHIRGDIRIRPTSGATLLGYPFGFFDQKHYLPVWKTGHVASEPQVDFDDKPVFLVDVSAFPGMSGSPVLAVANGIYESEDGVMRSGRVLKLLGIFSAMPVVRERVAPNPSNYSAEIQYTETNLQLGYVWKSKLIAELARAYVPR